MQEDITPPQNKQNQPHTDPSVAPAQAPVVHQQPAPTPPPPGDGKQPPEKAEQPPQPKTPKNNESHSNAGVIFFACLICSILVGIAIYKQISAQ